jgi:hypothetical protein
MIRPKELIDSEVLSKGKHYSIQLEFLTLEDVDSNAIYEAIAGAIINTGGARTKLVNITEEI